MPASELTLEQSEIADFDPATRAIVTAAAGTGKTHVLAARLTSLIETYGLRPGSDILILSFSRAAVAEIRRRLSASGNNASYAAALTFDAFATRLLGEVDPDGDWLTHNYDGRISSATKQLGREGPAVEYVRQYRHILVDEVQDLFGERAGLVESVLTTCQCGFTLFGDPAQSIYGYQERRDAGRKHRPSLYANVHSRFGDSIQRRELTENFRAKSTATRSVSAFGPRLRATDDEAAAARSDIDTFILGLTSVGDLRVAAPALRSEASGVTAVLCRTNGQALLVSRQLYDLGIKHRLQREASDKSVVGWVSAALQGVHSPRVPKSRLLERLKEIADAEGSSPTLLWSLLKSLDPRRTDDLDLRSVALRIRSGNIPEELNESEEATVVVSTIHRAKGLEFSRVVLVEPDSARSGDGDAAEEARLLYVALTRASDEILIMDRPDDRGLQRSDTAGKRWVRREFGRGFRRAEAIEVRGSDVQLTDPGADRTTLAFDLASIQAYIRSSVRSGDRVTLGRTAVRSHGESTCVFSVLHAGTVVGITNEQFANELLRVIGGSSIQWPDRISSLHVEHVDTEANIAGVQPEGGGVAIWSRVRVHGLGELEYDR